MFKKKLMGRLACALIILVVSVVCTSCGYIDMASIATTPTAKEPASIAPAAKEPITIVYTNDIHCQSEGDIGYRGIDLVKNALTAAGENVFLVDSGDHLQGELIGGLSEGEFPFLLMNAAGYDIACLGNHEFDYGVKRLKELASRSEYPYVCCNFADTEGNLIFDPYKIFSVGDTKIAFIGILTPDVMKNSDPANFKDESGNMLYDFYIDDTGDRLVAQVQKYVDQARGEGADYVIALSHLGVAASSSPFMSTELIPKLSGIDAVLDGHSHTVIEREDVTDKDGKPVILTQSGYRLADIGIMRISETGDITCSLVDNKELSETLSTIKEGIDEVAKEVIAHTDVDLKVYYPDLTDENGAPIRMVRRSETNLGDLCADSARWNGQSDIAIINSGSVRDDIPEGDITVADAIRVLPFYKPLYVMEIDGQTVLDMLEYGARAVPEETGSFPQVSGMSYDIDLSIDSSVKVDGEEFTVDGPRRVQNVMINGEPLDPDKKYTITSTSFVLVSGGDGYTFLPSRVTPIREGFISETDGLIAFLHDGLGGNVGEEYADPYGQGRIKMIEE